MIATFKEVKSYTYGIKTITVIDRHYVVFPFPDPLSSAPPPTPSSLSLTPFQCYVTA